MINDVQILSAAKLYKEIISLKKVLGIKADFETNRELMLYEARQRNKKEVFLLEYLIILLKTAPKCIKDRYKLLAVSELQQDFIPLYAQTEMLFQSNIQFKRFSNQADKYLSLKTNACRCSNMIYELAYSVISETSIFSAENAVMNLYLVQKWLMKHENDAEVLLTHQEKTVLKFLLQGCRQEEITASSILADLTSEEINEIIQDTLPAKYNTHGIMPALALHLYKQNCLK